MSVSEFGTTQDGKVVHKIDFASPRGSVRASVITFGGILQSVRVRNAGGDFTEVTLGFDTLAAYENGVGHIGATVGRFANRIRGGTFPPSYIGASEPIALPKNSGC